MLMLENFVGGQKFFRFNGITRQRNRVITWPKISILEDDSSLTGDGFIALLKRM